MFMSGHTPALAIYNVDASVMEFLRKTLQKEVGSLGRKPIKVNLKRERYNTLRKKPLYLIQISGHKLKRLLTMLPELEDFDKTRGWVEKVEEWQPKAKGRPKKR